MRFTSLVAALATVAGVVLAEDFPVAVGQGGLTFTPNQVTVKDGDSVTFTFYPKNHTVTQSTFASPCQRQASPLGVDSGYRAIPADAAAAAGVDNIWKITIVNASAPMWFYCAQGNHCASGMVFAINPTAEKTFDQFVANAAAPAGSSNGTATGTATGTAGVTAASGTTSSGSATIGGATGAAGTATNSLSLSATVSSVGTGSVPTPNAGVTEAEAQGAAPTGTPGNGAMKIGSSMTGLAAVAVVALLL